MTESTAKGPDAEAELGSRVLAWYAIGDWGAYTDSLVQLANAMTRFTEEVRPDFILCLGDNFYPNGVTTVESSDWSYWRKLFALNPKLNKVPWKVILGNHDYQSEITAQMDFTVCGPEINPNGLWQMRGDSEQHSPRRPTSSCYSFSFPQGTSITSDFHPVEYAAYAAKRRQQGEAEEARSNDEAATATDKPPSELYPPSTTRLAESSPPCHAYFVGFDSNASQFSVRRDPRHANIVKEFPLKKEWLDETMRLNDEKHRADGTWRFYFAHHPFFSNGRGHENEGRCLRTKLYTSVDDDGMKNAPTIPGLDLHSVLVRHKVDAVFAGHEHVMQAHRDETGMGHFCCGATVENYYWKGKHGGPHLDWAADASAKSGFGDQMGFGVGEIFRNEEKKTTAFRFKFVHSGTMEVIYSTTMTKKIA